MFVFFILYKAQDFFSPTVLTQPYIFTQFGYIIELDIASL